MYKKVLLAFIIIMAVLLNVGAFYLFVAKDKSTHKLVPEVIEKEETPVVTEFMVEDTLGMYNEKTLKSLAEEIKPKFEEFTGTILNVDENTTDYTEKLRSNMIAQAYTSIDGFYNYFQNMIHLRGEIKDIEYTYFSVRGKKEIPEMNIRGVIRFSGKSDLFNEGEYEIPIKLVYVKDSTGDYKVAYIEFDRVFDVVDFKTILYSHEDYIVTASSGTSVAKFNFAEQSYEDFLNQYSFNPQDYDEVIE